MRRPELLQRTDIGASIDAMWGNTVTTAVPREKEERRVVQSAPHHDVTRRPEGSIYPHLFDADEPIDLVEAAAPDDGQDMLVAHRMASGQPTRAQERLGQKGSPFAARSAGDHNRSQFVEGSLHLFVDDDVVEESVVLDFAPRCCETPR